jgi:hypothetical protein
MTRDEAVRTGDGHMSMTKEEVLALPVTVDLLTTARALGISRNLAYDMARAGEYPVKLYKVGTRYRCLRIHLLEALGIPDVPIPPNG